jgi:hypothetical protein
LKGDLFLRVVYFTHISDMSRSFEYRLKYRLEESRKRQQIEKARLLDEKYFSGLETASPSTNAGKNQMLKF